MATAVDTYNNFEIESGKIAASGNIMFLMDKTGELRDLSGKVCCFFALFDGCTSLTQAPILPAKTFAVYCYHNMFKGCTSIPEPKYNMSHMTFDEVANAI